MPACCSCPPAAVHHLSTSVRTAWTRPCHQLTPDSEQGTWWWLNTGPTCAEHAVLSSACAPTQPNGRCRCCRYTLLHVASGLGQTRTLELLLKHLGSSSALINDSSNDDGATPLHAAAMAGSAAAVRMLLLNGADAGVAGTDGTQAWELVPDADPAPSTAKQQAAGQQQDMQELQRMLKEAARKAGRSQASRSSKVTSSSEVAAGAAAAAAAQGPEEVYSEQFRQLSPAEQARKVEGFARLPASELKSVPHLSAGAKAAIVQVGAVEGGSASCAVIATASQASLLRFFQFGSSGACAVRCGALHLTSVELHSSCCARTRHARCCLCTVLGCAVGCSSGLSLL